MSEGVSIPNRPWRLAAIVAGLYCLVALIYIHFSSRIAASATADVATLERIEMIKGNLFVATTALLLFLGLRYLFGKLKENEFIIKEQNRSILEAEKRITEGLFAASVAHDLNNVSVITRSCIDELRERGTRDEQEDVELLDELAQVTERVHDCASRLAAIRGGHIPPGNCLSDVAGIVQEAVQLARSHETVKYCQVTTEIPPSLRSMADPSMLHRATLNMLINAGDATNGNGHILVRLSDADKKTISLEVHDNGPGIPAEQREQVVRAFYTTKRNGSGLGFFCLQNCARRHKGRLVVESSELGGACVRIVFPLQAEKDSSEKQHTEPFHAKARA